VKFLALLCGVDNPRCNSSQHDLKRSLYSLPNLEDAPVSDCRWALKQDTLLYEIVDACEMIKSRFLNRTWDSLSSSMDIVPSWEL